MNYKKIYEDLITRAKNNPREGYTERHHIIPVCLGGGNEPENLVNLTPEEHYVAHQLLVKIHPSSHALAKAAAMMVCNRSNNKLYGWVRRRFSEAMRVSQSGSKNNMYGTKWIYSTELKKSIRIPVDQDVPEGWTFGRKFDFSDKSKVCVLCGSKHKGSGETCSRECRSRLTYKKHEKKAYKIFREYVESGETSLTAYSKMCNITQPGLTQLFRKYIIGYKDVVQQGKTLSIEELTKLLNKPL